MIIDIATGIVKIRKLADIIRSASNLGWQPQNFNIVKKFEIGGYEKNKDANDEYQKNFHQYFEHGLISGIEFSNCLELLRAILVWGDFGGAYVAPLLGGIIVFHTY